VVFDSPLYEVTYECDVIDVGGNVSPKRLEGFG
jgi:hypothetical protein